MILPVGIDVSKDNLEVFCEGQSQTIENKKGAIKDYFSRLKDDIHVVMEATGKYHRLAQTVLSDMGIAVMLVNPYQTKNFSKSLNILCKTDKVDAKLLCHFADRMLFIETSCPSKVEEKMQELVRYLQDLKTQRVALSHRKEGAMDFILCSQEKLLAQLDKEVKATELALNTTLDDDKELSSKRALLESIPGVGRLTATILRGLLNEIGTLNKQTVAALVGVAPVNNDSGYFQGKRRIRGGRHDLRAYLYRPVLGAATKHNPRLKQEYERLIAKGKAKKLALTACMRKLVIWANAIVASGHKWDADWERTLSKKA